MRWACYDSDKYEKRIITDAFDNTTGSETGSRMVTPDGDSGVLVCHSDMGLTPMDLFNDILNNEDDLKEYLGKTNYKESEKISLRKIFKAKIGVFQTQTGHNTNPERIFVEIFKV